MERSILGNVLLKAQVSLQLGEIFSSDNGVSVNVLIDVLTFTGIWLRER